MTSKIVPSRLYKVKIFESVEYFGDVSDGRVRLSRSDDILETQINNWIQETKVLVVATGPIGFTTRQVRLKPVKKCGPQGCPPNRGLVTKERRTVSITYVPPVEQEDHVYGEHPRAKTTAVPAVGRQLEPSDSMSARRISDGGSGG